MKTATVNFKTDDVTKAKVQAVAKQIGIPLSNLLNAYFKGKYLGYRSLDVTGDVRALYTVQGDTVTIFGFRGSHSQLY